MTTWTADELDRIGAADELQIASARRDGTLRRYVTIWVVRVGDDLYVRSYRGTEGTWFRHALSHPEGRVRARGVERDVRFEQTDGTAQDSIDQAYRSKYARYGSTYVDPMVGPDAVAATFRLLPR